jgi:ABC-type multidrug transport system ATPase subunit
MLRGLRTQGLTMLVSTPYMDEAELCDRVALIQKGEIMAIDTPQGITAAFRQPLMAVRSDNMYQLIKDLRAFEGAEDCYAFGDYAHLKLESPRVKAAEVEHFLHARNHRNIEVKPARPTVEDCFIELMKN